MNANFTGRAGRIIAWLDQHPSGLRTSEVHQLEKEMDPTANAARVAASLAQLFAKKKIDRIGRAFQYTYLLPKHAGKHAGPTPKTAPKAKQYASPLARAPKKESQPVVVSKRAKKQHPTLIKPRQAAANAAPETVEEFLARGGRIQHCAHGERGFEPKSYQQQSQAHKDRVRAEVIAKNKAKPRNQRTAQNDDADLDDVA